MKRTLLIALFLILAPATQGLALDAQANDLLDPSGQQAANNEMAGSETGTQGETRAEAPGATETNAKKDAETNAETDAAYDPAWLEDIDPQAWLAEQLAEIPLTDAQAPGLEILRFMAQPNGTNETVLNETGTTTHVHGGIGGNGLFDAWSTPFYGEARIILEVDVNKDGVNDAVLGTNSAVVAISGNSNNVLWAYHLGNRIMTLEFMEDRQEFLYASLWEGQLGEVGRLSLDGHSVWKQADATHYLSAAATTDGIIVATISGYVEKMDFDGNQIWSYDTRTVPDVSAIVAAHVNAGTYLAEAADYNGDGVTDMAVATLNLRFVFGLYVYSIEYYTQIHAVDGATGNMLWISTENADPVHGISINALADLEAFDARGDGSMDLAYDGLTLRWYMLPLAPSLLITYETFLRAVDGDSVALAQPMGGRTLGGVLLPLEVYGDIERVDANGDGKEEVAVIRLDVANALLGNGVAIESYSFIPHAPGNGGTMVLSDVAFHNGNYATLSSYEGSGRELFIGSTEENTALQVRSNLVDVVDLEFAAPALVGGVLNGNPVVATKSHFIAGEVATPLRGTPVKVHSANYDNDGTPDFFVESTDGFVYAIDGLNGIVVDSMAKRGYLVAMNDVNQDGSAEFIFAEEYGSEGTLSAVSFAGDMVWEAYYDAYDLYLHAPVAFDGNQDGVMDFLVQTREALAINGKTGSPLWNSGENLGYFVDEVKALDDGNLAIMDWNDLFVVNGKTGKVMVDFQADSWEDHACVGTMPTSTGTSTIVIGDNWFDDYIYVYEVTSAAPKNLNLIDGVLVISCSIEMYDGGSLISVSYANHEYELVQKVMRINDGEVVWAETFVDSTLTMYAPVGLDKTTNRVFFAVEDHVRGLNWTTGDREVDFTVNGPFLQQGIMANVDRLGGSEVAALASNGILWLVSQSDDIQETLVKQAELQGKESLDVPTTSTDDEAQETPVPWFLGLAALAIAFVIRRR